MLVISVQVQILCICLPREVSQAYLGPAGTFQVSRCEMVGGRTLSVIDLETFIGK